MTGTTRGTGRRLLGLVLGLLLIGLSPLQANEILDSVRKLLRNSNDSIRADAVTRLSQLDTVDSATMALGMAHDRSWRVRRAVEKTLASYRSEQVVEWLEETARLPGRPEADAAIALAFGKARHPGAKDLLLTLLDNKAWKVRRAAIDGLGMLGDPSTAPALSGILSEKEATLRVQAVEALTLIGADECVEPVISALDDKDWQVRAAAVTGLKKFRSKKSIGPLIDLLGREKGRMSQDAWTALVEITGFSFDFDVDVWRAWWDRSKDGFRPPPARRSGSKPSVDPRNQTAKKKSRYAQKTTSYYGIQTASKRILFLLDISQSMSGTVDNVIVKKERKGDRYALAQTDKTYKSNVKLEIAKEELIDTIKGLDPKTEFNIVAYETRVHPWQKKMVKAAGINKNRAIEFVKKQKAAGVDALTGTRRGQRKDTRAGQTNIFDALESAFKSAGVGVYDKHYRSGVDTIFLLSDGVPTVGKVVKGKEIIDEVTRMNVLRRVVIHTINIGRNARLLQELSRATEGKFVNLTPNRG